MSWDFDLYAKDEDGNFHNCGWWNYTHNCNEMIATALDNAGVISEGELRTYWVTALGRCWFDLFRDKTAKETTFYLEAILAEFSKEPAKYEAMNPENGWGSFETLKPVLTEMLEAAKKHPSAVWSVYT